MRYDMMQVGLGDFGRRWLQIVRDHPSWRCAAIATRNLATLEQCGVEAGIPPERRFASLEEAFEAGVKADALLVTTPHFRHEQDIIDGLSRGMHVLVEKPLAGSWQACLRIREVSRAAGGLLMVGENYRFGEGPRIAREVVASGEIGVPEFLSMHYFVGHAFPEGDWRNDYQCPVLIENATHQFDLVRYITNTNARNVFCTAFGSRRTPHWRAPSVSAQFTMENGFHFQFAGSWSYDELRTPWEGTWRLYGSEGALDWKQDRIEIVRGSTSRVFDVPSMASDHTLTATFEEFTAALSERRLPATGIEDNMQTLAMVFGAVRSSERDVPVSIPEMLAEHANRVDRGADAGPYSGPRSSATHSNSACTFSHRNPGSIST